MTSTTREPRKRSPARAPTHSAAWRNCLTAPVDVASLAVFRIAFGAILLVEMYRFLALGWVHDYIGPVFHFTYFGFEWVQPLPPLAMIGVFVVLGLCALLIAVGWQYRWAVALFGVGFTYVFLLEKSNYLNHFYLISLLCLVMSLTPASRAFSVDALRPGFASDYVPAWNLWLLRLQVAIPYFFGGVAKLNGDWLHGQPMQLWMSRMTHVQAVIPAFGEPWLALVLSWGGCLFDLLIVPFLLLRRTRPVAFVLAVMFHLSNAVMFQIGIFPWYMICATTLFLEPDWPRKLIARLPRATHAMPKSLKLPIGGNWTIGLLVLFFAIQVLLPLRHLLYPGKVDWTDEGTHFSWRMMLNDKTSTLSFVAVDHAQQQATPLDFAPLLTPRQLDKMSTDPEMLREFAVFLGQQMRQQGDNREVHAIVFCALNGRKPQRLVDPSVNLATEPRRFGPAPFIVPLTEPLPDKAWLVPHSEWQRTFDLK
jgi:hypothetical protein